ncbi:hypothetical protein PSZ24_23500, partial [Shigella flexneri]|nr:hypothetical protein [Shigella flexneri]
YLFNIMGKGDACWRGSVFPGQATGEYASSPTCITFSHNIKQINSFFNEFICLILWEKVMHVGEEAYSHNIKQINSLKNERFLT